MCLINVFPATISDERTEPLVGINGLQGVQRYEENAPMIFMLSKLSQEDVTKPSPSTLGMLT